MRPSTPLEQEAASLYHELFPMDLKAFLRRQHFDPSLVGIFVSPFFLTRRALIRKLRPLASEIRGITLDVGCGQKPYESLYGSSKYVGLEYDTPENRATKLADVYYDGGRFPFEDGHFDSIVCNQVIEHISEPDAFIGEMARVLKPGGRLLLTSPFLWDEHDAPQDFIRLSVHGVRDLLKRHGFSVEKEAKTLSDASILFQIANVYLFKAVFGRNKVLNLLTLLFAMAPLSFAGLIAGAALPKNPDLYVDSLVLASKK